MRAFFPFAGAVSVVLGCAYPVYLVPAPVEPPLEEVREPSVATAYERTIDRVSGMVMNDDLRLGVARRGLSLVNLTWEDTGRLQGSAVGPNISDLTLEVRRRDGEGRLRTALLPVIRHPNFSDRTADVSRDRFFVRVGNEHGEALRTLPLAELLGDVRRFASAPDTLGNEGTAPIDLTAARDTHYLVSAQAVFLPIPRRGKAEFNPVVFNYQSAPGSPAVLAILATREGTSLAVIENRDDDTGPRGMGQELYFNEAGQRAAFSAERRGEVVQRIAAQGGPKSEADRSALGRGADLMALIQVPLKHANRGPLGGAMPASGGGYGYEFSDDPLAAGGYGPNDATIRVRPGPMRTDVERAVLGHGAKLGPFFEGHGAKLVRDEQFPVRITVQFYKATSDGLVSEADLAGIQRNLESAYAHADYVGSLVVPEGDGRRPTAWQKVPGEWWPW
jgi:hypothetical protein